jgi:hypothetical protein
LLYQDTHVTTTTTTTIATAAGGNLQWPDSSAFLLTFMVKIFCSIFFHSNIAIFRTVTLSLSEYSL